MKTWKIYDNNSVISGENLIEAVTNSLDKLKWINQRSVIPATVVKFEMSYDSGILGGTGGVQLILTKQVVNRFNAPAELEYSKIWIIADFNDCLESVTKVFN